MLRLLLCSRSAGSVVDPYGASANLFACWTHAYDTAGPYFPFRLFCLACPWPLESPKLSPIEALNLENHDTQPRPHPFLPVRYCNELSNRPRQEQRRQVVCPDVRLYRLEGTAGGTGVFGLPRSDRRADRAVFTRETIQAVDPA